MVITLKDKIMRFIKNNKWLLLTFLLSSVVVSIIYTLQKIAPFGNNSMLDVDFYHQYGPLLNELYDRIKSGESLLYSFNTAGGMPFYKNFANYLSSPFNIILFLFKKENIVMAFSIIIGLKVIFASITMQHYLNKTFKKNNFITMIFGLLYALSGYFCAYYWNIMWLDGMVFLPIIMLGINKIIEEEKPNTYIISLAVMLFANYFIGYMICIFSVIYFLGLFWYKNNFKLKNVVKKFLMFFISSLAAGALVAFILLPLFYSMSSISATGDLFPLASSSFSITDFIFNHITGVSRTVFASDILPLPNVYPGLISLVLIVLLFLNKNVNIRFKILSVIAILFFFFSFNITTFDFIWHAFHVPNDLPWRYSFIYTFVLIVIAYYSFIKLKEVSLFKICISFGIIALIILLASKLNFENLNDAKIITCIALLALYFIIFVLLKNRSNKIVLCVILTLGVSFEVIFGINSNWSIDHDIKTFMQDKKPYTDLIKEIKKDDNGLYRIEKTDYLTLNDGAWYDYHGISVFSSMAYEDTAKAQRNLGLAGNNINSYYYKYYQTPVYNTMFNVKYLLGNYIENDYYVPIDVKDNHALVGYNYSSSIMYAVNNKLEDLSLVSYNPFLNQSNFVTLSTNVKDIFNKAQVTSVTGAKITEDDFYNNSNGTFNYELTGKTNEFTFNIDNVYQKNLYLYIGGENVSSFTVNGSYYSLTSDEYFVFDTGRIYDDNLSITISLQSSDNGNVIFYAYYLDDSKFKEFYDEIKDEALNVKRYSDTLIEGDVNVNDDKLMFTTISYDDGWTVYVDDKKVKTKKVMDAYLAFDIDEGKHNIKLVYYPKGMTLGVIITGISLGLFLIYNFKFKKTSQKSNKR